MLLPLVAGLILDPSRLNVGVKWSGEQVVRYHSREAEIDETHRFKVAFRVTGQESKLWVVERKGVLLGSWIAGVDLGPPPSSEPEVTHEWLSPAGFLLDLKPYDKGLFALDRLIHFWLPAHLPDEWTVDLSTETSAYASKGRATFKLLGKPGSYSREYTFDFRSVGDPAGISATGRIRFDQKSGRILQAKIEAKQADLPGGTEKANVTLTYADESMPKPLE